MIQIYHNARCGKSRNCLAFLNSNNLEYQIINYLVDIPTFEDCTTIIKKLKINPIDLIRQKEKIWIDFYKNKVLTNQEIIQAMIENPILMERPIVVFDNEAIIARDLEKLADFFNL